MYSVDKVSLVIKVTFLIFLPHINGDLNVWSTLCNSLYQAESRWLCGNTLATDANGPGSTPGGTLELDTGNHPFVGR